MKESNDDLVVEEKGGLPPQEGITVEGKGTVSAMDELRAAPKVKIVIDEQENHEGSRDVRLGIEGYVINIQRGKVVSIPEPFIKVLQDSVYTIIYKDDTGTERRREVPRFNWRRV